MKRHDRFLKFVTRFMIAVFLMTGFTILSVTLSGVTLAQDQANADHEPAEGKSAKQNSLAKIIRQRKNQESLILETYKEDSLAMLKKQIEMLDEAQKQVMEQGDLDAVFMIKAMKEAAEDSINDIDVEISLSSWTSPETLPDADKLHDAVNFRKDTQTNIEKELAASTKEMLQTEQSALEELMKELTKQGKIDDAIAVRTVRDAVKSELEHFSATPARPIGCTNKVMVFPKEKNISAFNPEAAQNLEGGLQAISMSTRCVWLPNCGDWTEAGVLNKSATQLLTGSDASDPKARLFDIATRRILGEMKNEGSVTDTVFHPALPLLFSVDTTPVIHVWDAGTCQKHADYTPMPGCNIMRIAINKTGKHAVAGTDLGRVFAWDCETGKMVREFTPAHEGEIRDLVFHPNGRIFASAGVDGKVCLWNAEDGKLVREIKNAAKQDLFCVRFSPDGSKLAVTAKWNDQYTSIYDVATGELWANYGGYGHAIRSVNFSPDGRFLVTGDVDFRVVIWDIATKMPVWSDARNQGNHIYRVMFTPNQKFLIVISGFNPSIFEMPSSISGE